MRPHPAPQTRVRIALPPPPPPLNVLCSPRARLCPPGFRARVRPGPLNTQQAAGGERSVRVVSVSAYLRRQTGARGAAADRQSCRRFCHSRALRTSTERDCEMWGLRGGGGAGPWQPGGTPRARRARRGRARRRTDGHADGCEVLGARSVVGSRVRRMQGAEHGQQHAQPQLPGDCGVFRSRSVPSQRAGAEDRAGDHERAQQRPDAPRLAGPALTPSQLPHGPAKPLPKPAAYAEAEDEASLSRAFNL